MKNLDLIICEAEGSELLFYKEHYSVDFRVINLNDKNLDELVKKSKGLVYLSSGSYLDLVNFSCRDLADSLLIYRFSNELASNTKDRLYPHPDEDDCADYAVFSGCFYLNQADCKKVHLDLLDFQKTISKKHIEVFNIKPFSPDEYNRAIFLDRDGVLNVDTGYTFELQKLELVAGAASFLKKASLKFPKLLVVTNQAGVAKGLYDEESVLKFNKKLQEKYQEKGVELTSFEYCPFHIDGTNTKYKKHSYLRKPHVAMVYKHLYNLPIRLSESIMIGDRESDILNEELLKYFILESRYLEKKYTFQIYKNFEEIEKSLLLT